MKLYNIDGCGYCAMVREVLTQMSLDYEKIDVPWPHHQRQEVHEISGQTSVPVLVDGDTILAVDIVWFESIFWPPIVMIKGCQHDGNSTRLGRNLDN